MPSLTSDQVAFANQVAAQTGLSPQVVEAQEVIEGNPNGYTGSYNFLNITTTGKGVKVPGNSLTFASYASLSDAVAAAVREYQSLGIVKTAAGQAPNGQIAAIAASPWDGGHYGGAGGPNLLNAYRSITGQGVTLATPNPGSAQAQLTAQESGDTCLWRTPNLNPLPSWIPFLGNSVTGCIISRQQGESVKAVGMGALALVLAVLGIHILVRSDPIGELTSALRRERSAAPASQPAGENMGDLDDATRQRLQAEYGVGADDYEFQQTLVDQERRQRRARARKAVRDRLDEAALAGAAA